MHIKRYRTQIARCIMHIKRCRTLIEQCRPQISQDTERKSTLTDHKSTATEHKSSDADTGPPLQKVHRCRRHLLLHKQRQHPCRKRKQPRRKHCANGAAHAAYTPKMGNSNHTLHASKEENNAENTTICQKTHLMTRSQVLPPRRPGTRSRTICSWSGSFSNGNLCVLGRQLRKVQNAQRGATGPTINHKRCIRVSLDNTHRLRATALGMRRFLGHRSRRLDASQERSAARRCLSTQGRKP